MNQYRKRKALSLDGSVPGIQYNRYHRGYNRTVFDPSPVAGPVHAAQMYDPDPGLAEFPEASYDAYQCGMPQHATPPLRLEPPEPPVPDRPPTYDDGVFLSELLADCERTLRESWHQPESQEPLPFDHDVRAQNIMHGSGSLEEMVAEPVPSAPLQAIEAIISKQVTPDLDHYILHDDYLRQFQDETNQLLDSLWNAQPPATQPDPFWEDAPALDDQIQIGCASPSMPEAEPPEEDLREMQQRMHDEQMQQLMDPFGMMGPGPMM